MEYGAFVRRPTRANFDLLMKAYGATPPGSGGGDATTGGDQGTTSAAISAAVESLRKELHSAIDTKVNSVVDKLNELSTADKDAADERKAMQTTMTNLLANPASMLRLRNRIKAVEDAIDDFDYTSVIDENGKLVKTFQLLAPQWHAHASNPLPTGNVSWSSMDFDFGRLAIIHSGAHDLVPGEELASDSPPGPKPIPVEVTPVLSGLNIGGQKVELQKMHTPAQRLPDRISREFPTGLTEEQRAHLENIDRLEAIKVAASDNKSGPPATGCTFMGTSTLKSSEGVHSWLHHKGKQYCHNCGLEWSPS